MVQKLYYRNRRYYTEYKDAVSGIPSFEHVALMGPMERGWERFTMQDLPGGVIMIKKDALAVRGRDQGSQKESHLYYRVYIQKYQDVF